MLCPPMEWRASQVEIEPSKEEPCIDPFIIEITLPARDDSLSVDDLSTGKKILLLALIEGLNQSNIAKNLKISRQYVNHIITKYQNKIVSHLKNGD